jgi:hypothetical protein
MILHTLEVMYQKMEEHGRMWKPESKRPEEQTEENMAGILRKQRYKDKTVQCICKAGTTIQVPNLAGYM